MHSGLRLQDAEVRSTELLGPLETVAVTGQCPTDQSHGLAFMAVKKILTLSPIFNKGYSIL